MFFELILKIIVIAGECAGQESRDGIPVRTPLWRHLLQFLLGLGEGVKLAPSPCGLKEEAAPEQLECRSCISAHDGYQGRSNTMGRSSAVFLKCSI